ncbi:hypothetical protein VTN31DRAFT_6991 [Thermomyces dupontii]|uniref:uncharacterized protein n=1 Tax=Talaromyces thermophilus TaxID=28565 RepID=UPI003742EE5F
MPESDLPIIIIGAGISGLSLAQYLRREKIPYHVFERDASVDARPGGWGLTLHWGLPALQELLPPELYDRLKETNVNVEAVNDPGRYLFFDLKNGEPKYSLDFPKTGRLRVLRTKLRKLLTTGLDISWSKKLVEVQENSDSVTAIFDDGTTCKGRLIVGCDGSASRVRKYVYPTAYENQTVPVWFVGTTVRYTPEQIRPALELDPYFFQGTHSETNVYLYFSVLNTPRNVGNDTDYYIAQAVVTWSYDKNIEIPDNDAETVALIKQLTSNWASPFRELIETIPEDAELRRIHISDWYPTTKREHERVVVMGDAAHSMTMFRGEGGNNAVVDAHDFAKRVGHLLKQKDVPFDDIAAGLRQYDEDILVRGRASVINSRQACLDAHDYANLTEQSPLVARRVRSDCNGTPNGN